MPKSESATVIMPLAAPPRKATCKAALKPFFEDAAERRLAEVDITIPTIPATADENAPSVKETAVCQPSSKSPAKK